MGCRSCTIPSRRLVRTHWDISSSLTQDQTRAPKIPILWLFLGCKSPASTAGAFWWGEKHPAPANFDALGVRHSWMRGSHPRAENPLQKHNFGISGFLPGLAQCHRRGRGLFLHHDMPKAPFWALDQHIWHPGGGGGGWCLVWTWRCPERRERCGCSVLGVMMLPLLSSLDFGRLEGCNLIKFLGDLGQLAWGSGNSLWECAAGGEFLPAQLLEGWEMSHPWCPNPRGMKPWRQT